MAPDFPRVTVSPTDVWTYAARELTSITGTPRSDLLGEDATFEGGTAARKARIDRLMAAEAETEGTITANGTEQTLISSVLAVQHHMEAYLDLAAMSGIVSACIRQYMVVVSGGPFRRYAEEFYTGAQPLPVLYLVTKIVKYGLSVSLQATSGLSVPYEFFTRRRA